MKRIFLFLVTNLAVLALLSLAIFVVERVFGVHLTGGGLGGLLVFAAICGFGGALISLALSKWTAKRMLGVRVITHRRAAQCGLGGREQRPAARHVAQPDRSGIGTRNEPCGEW